MKQLNTARLARALSIAIVTVALATPLASPAHDRNAAMDACINAFVAASLPKEQPVTVRKEVKPSTPVSMLARSYKIVVSAKGVESGKYLARGTCIVDRSGQVIALNGKPLGQKLAAR